MKEKIMEFLKALGAYVVIGLLLASWVVGVIGELFPTAIPDWMWTVVGIINAPLIIAFFVWAFKEWRRTRKNKKAKKEKTKKK